MKAKIKNWRDVEKLSDVCYDCGINCVEYGDLYIVDDLWEKINPTVFKGVGNLCPNCLLNRLIEIGITDFKLEIKN